MQYIKALIVLIIYVVFTRSLFIAMVLFPNTPAAFLIEVSSASFFGFLWLYFFEHENLFSFVKIIKNKKKSAEQKFLDKFIKFGAVTATILIGYIGGPLFASLTSHLILKDFKYKYLLVIFICATSSFVALALARGVLHLVIRLV
ncbi:MAG TPA: hypothetical protein VG895_05225 [Patescibacteria group bacterium]|nr:hypothetical protein [Patescibacteria group bacterium]